VELTSSFAKLGQNRRLAIIDGLGQFGAAVSATKHFGDWMFRRCWSQMFYAKNVCFWNTL